MARASKHEKRRAKAAVRLPLLAARKQVACGVCASCCTYVTVDIAGPGDVEGASEMLWYLYHDRVSVYATDGGEWLVQFETRCRNLGDDLRCQIYEHRPQVCREYDETKCEINAPDEGLDFYTPEAFLAYLAKELPKVHRGLMKELVPPQASALRRAGPAAVPPIDRRYKELRALGEP